MAWLLCDYGEVRALAPSAADRDALESEAGTGYALALKALRAAPQDVTFMGDRPENILAARRAGMRAMLFTSSSPMKDPAAHGTVPQGADQ